VKKGRRLQEFERLCRQQGLPLTVQRRVILEAITDREDHPTAEQIFAAVQDRIPGVSRTTVYRVLNMLVRMRIVQKIYQPGAATRFDPATHQHHHFACIHCHRVIDLEDDSLNAIALPDMRDRGFQVTESHIYFRGTCPSCRAKLAQTSRLTAGTRKRAGTKSTKRNTRTSSAKKRGKTP
jgi:Fur family peroxide stress response transcriptional regulator